MVNLIEPGAICGDSVLSASFGPGGVCSLLIIKLPGVFAGNLLFVHVEYQLFTGLEQKKQTGFCLISGNYICSILFSMVIEREHGGKISLKSNSFLQGVYFQCRSEC